MQPSNNPIPPSSNSPSSFAPSDAEQSVIDQPAIDSSLIEPSPSESPSSSLSDQDEKATSLSEQQEKAILALLAHSNLEKAAAVVGVSRVTLWRWTRLPAFQSALATARTQAFNTAIARLKNAAADAVDTLTRQLTSGVPSTEIRAAVAILNQSHKVTTLLDHETRLSDAERLLLQLNQPSSPQTANAGSESGSTTKLP